MQQLLRKIPSVTELLDRPAIKGLMDQVHRNAVVSGVREFLDDLREDVQKRAQDVTIPSPNELAESIAEWIKREQDSRLRRVINATGILLHTGLGRAPLAQEALTAIEEVASGYANVEVDLESGKRSQRIVSVQKLLCQLTGAEAAIVVNNNAGATLLCLAALAGGKEVIVSRGQLVEIGGSFRLPDVMQSSGAILKEVGTTNKTRVGDYRDAICENTGALLRVHTSNYKVVGFTEEAALTELVQLAKARRLPFIDDIGSGALVDYAKYGFPDEPLARDSIAAGSDVVLFSGDKLLGGPQCGIIVGKKTSIDRIAKHPLMRALRVDKVTLAALRATLDLYHDVETAEERVPLLAMLSTSVDNLQQRGERICAHFTAVAGTQADVVESEAYLGGGSIPTQRFPTRCVAISIDGHTPDGLSKRLRTGTPAVFARIQNDKVLLDLRSVPPNQDQPLREAVLAIASQTTPPD